MTDKVFIMAGGPVDDRHLRQLIEEHRPTAVICADGGARHAKRIHITPMLIVGDMDSLSPEEEQWFADQGCPIIRHPAAKEETDTALAFTEALRLQPREVWIMGATGNRLDHTLANLALLLRGEVAGVKVRIVDQWCEAFLVKEHYILEGTTGQTVSIFPFPDKADGVTLEGFEYPLRGAVMTPDNPYGISNRLVSPPGRITVEKGALLVVRFHQVGVFPW